MSYPDELCRLVIRNMKLLDEGDDIIDEIQSVIFAAINARLEALVSTRDGWEGTFDLVMENDSGKTRFAPHSWGELKLAYELSETDDDTAYWVTSALGQRKSKLCLQIIPQRTPKKYRGIFGKISDYTDVFHNNDIEYNDKTGAFYARCSLDMEQVLAEYPHLNSSLDSVNCAFDRLLAAHDHYERIAKGDLAYYEDAEEKYRRDSETE